MDHDTLHRTSSRSKRLKQTLLRIGGLCVCCYFGVLIVLMALENWLVFRPTPVTEDWSAPPNNDVIDVVLPLEDGSQIHAWWCPKSEADAALLYCHGNAGNLSHRGQIIATIQNEWNVSVLIFDYPGYGKSTGRPSEQGCYAAGKAALEWLLHEKQIPGERIILFGNSLGGGVAVHLATRYPHRALVLSSTFTALPDVAARIYPFLPCRLVMRNRFDNLKHIAQCRKPLIIVHGTRDELVPFDHAQALFAEANEPKMFYPLENGNHNSGISVAFLREARRFLEQVEQSVGSTK